MNMLSFITDYIEYHPVLLCKKKINQNFSFGYYGEVEKGANIKIYKIEGGQNSVGVLSCRFSKYEDGDKAWGGCLNLDEETLKKHFEINIEATKKQVNLQLDYLTSKLNKTINDFDKLA